MAYCLYMQYLNCLGGLLDESLCKDISFITVFRDGTITNEFYALFELM